MTINGKGDIAMVYTKSSLEINPSIWFTGRRAEDPLGMMTISELEIYRGLNYANNVGTDDRNRWGDYASMMVDPVNDSTFWFTSMYPTKNASFANWGTRIVAMNLSESENSLFIEAGPDTIICINEQFKTAAVAGNYSYVLWNTNGSGSFEDKHKLNTYYFNSSADLQNVEVLLSLYAEGNVPGTSANDSLRLYFQNYPMVDAGPDDTICLQDSYFCAGQVSFSNNYYWTSSGTGSFNDSTLLNAIYTPSVNDTANAWITLTLRAMPVTPCQEAAEDNVILSVKSCLGTDEMVDRLDIRFFPNPSNGLVNLEITNLHDKECIIHLLDYSGKMIFTGTYAVTNNCLKKQFNFSMLQKGVYYCRISTLNKTRTVQLIIQ
jgi:hypothetical protein